MKSPIANARSSRLSENIHWITVAVVVVLLILSFFGHIDPHGPGNRAFRWHSALGIVLYVLAGSRLMLRLIRRPAGHAADEATANSMLSTASRLAFYTVLVALPISGWMLASEEGVPVDLLGIPALPLWLFSMAAQSGSAWHTAAMQDSTLVTALIRIHVSLAVALSATVVLHAIQTVVDAPRSRSQSRDND